MNELYQKYCVKLAQTDQHRSLPRFCKAPSTALPLIDFSTHDYLALSRSPVVLQAAIEVGQRYGLGSTGSRLLSGNSALFEDFEQQIAQDMATEAALIFNSGFQANVTVLASLLDQKVLQDRPLVFFDRLNHASLYEAVAHSQGELIRYRHGDMDHLQSLLKSQQTSKRPKFLVTETLFSMDGDLAPLTTLVDFAATYGAFLYLDEAHATGLVGPHGYGLSTTLNLSGLPHVIMSTFSKALGCFGATVTCDRVVRDYLINRCNGFKYTTALSPVIVGAAAQAWSLLPRLNDVRAQLFQQADTLRSGLQSLGFSTGLSQTPLIPVLLASERRTLDAAQHLYDQGIKVSAIRPPTVPTGSSRLRLALTPQHTTDNIQRLFQGLASL